MELMDADVAATIAKMSVEKIYHAFISAAFEQALKNICLNNPDIVFTLNANKQAMIHSCMALK